MEVLAFGHPEANLVVPVVAADSNGNRFVHASLSYDSTVHFLAIRSKFDEARTKRVFEVPDVGRHNNRVYNTILFNSLMIYQDALPQIKGRKFTHLDYDFYKYE